MIFRSDTDKAKWLLIVKMGAVGLLMAGLFLPFWYEQKYVTGIVITKVYLGLWVDRVCEGEESCVTYWHTSADYSRHEMIDMPNFLLVRNLETIGTALGLMGVLGLAGVGILHRGMDRARRLLHGLVYLCCMAGGLLSIVGVIATMRNNVDSAWATGLACGGGALLMASSVLSFFLFRWSSSSYSKMKEPEEQQADTKA